MISYPPRHQGESFQGQNRLLRKVFWHADFEHRFPIEI